MILKETAIIGIWIIIGAVALWGFDALGLLSPHEAGLASAIEVDLPEVYRIWREKEAIFVDSHPPAAFKRAHIPGAVNVPLGTLKQVADTLSRLSIGRDESVILYCSGAHCPNAHQLMFLFLRLGYRNVRVFSRGLEIWKVLGYPLEKDGRNGRRS